MRILFAAVAAMLFVSCATPIHEFSQGLRNQAQFEEDVEECKFEAEKVAVQHDGRNAAFYQEDSYARVFNACMRARQYR